MGISRREAIRLGLVGVCGPALGCGDSTAGTGPALDASLDANPDAAIQITRGISKGPWVQLLGPGEARLRFETRVDEASQVTIQRSGGVEEYEPTRAPRELEYYRLPFGPMAVADEVGLHVIHELVLEGLEAGEVVEWSVRAPDGAETSGSFQAGAAPTSGFRFAWLADTSFPMASDTVAVLAAQSPQVTLHGGDITYQPNPLDSWNLAMQSFAPLFRVAPMHFVVGNHEFEMLDEITEQFDRLFAGQGEGDPRGRFHAFTFGGIRFLSLDTESGVLESMDEPQLAWIDAELEAFAADESLREVIPMFHRPVYTLSKHSPSDTTVRDLLHERFVRHGVRLVLMGHAHCYERFVVDGIHYVVDGGGGAALYDPNREVEETDALRPGESMLRVAVSKSRGGLIVDLGDDGSMRLRRLQSEDGSVFDEAMIERPMAE